MKKNLFLLLISILVSSCETQLGTAVVTAMENVVTGKAFSGSAADVAYENYKKEVSPTPGISQDTNPIGSCTQNDIDLFPLSTSNADSLTKIKNNMCSCQVWGTCDANSCACGVLCPDNFSILNRTGLALDESNENSMAFTNGDPMFYKTDPTYTGYCWGHAVITQRFNRLAKFDASAPKAFPDGELSEKELEQRHEYYESILKKISNNEPVDIPGFKNLNEFSKNLEIKKLLKELIKQNWATNAMSFQGLSVVATSEPQGSEYYNKLFDDIEYRLKNFQSPTIVFNRKGLSVMAHAVLVSGVGVEKNGERYLCIRDNNDHASETQNCGMKMRLKSDGTCYYDGWYSDIGVIKLSHAENGDTVEQMKNLRSKCQGDKNCSAEKNN